MSSVMISTRSFTPAQGIASGVAERLGLSLINDSLYQAAAERFGVPDRQLRRAFEKGPSLVGMQSARRRRLASCVEAELSSRFARGAAVYEGPFAALRLRGVAHILKVRVTAGLAERIGAAQRQGVARNAAARRVRSSDGAARQIAWAIFGREDMDSDYDLVVNLADVSEAEAIDSIVETAMCPAYRSTSFSRRCLHDLELANTAAARLACELGVDVEAELHEGVLRVRAEASERRREHIQKKVESIATELTDIRRVEVRVVDCWLRPLPNTRREDAP
jgi:hypothetical protein